MVLEEGDHLDLAYREASRWLDGTTPRTAKRLANRLLLHHRGGHRAQPAVDRFLPRRPRHRQVGDARRALARPRHRHPARPRGAGRAGAGRRRRSGEGLRRRRDPSRPQPGRGRGAAPPPRQPALPRRPHPRLRPPRPIAPSTEIAVGRAPWGCTIHDQNGQGPSAGDDEGAGYGRRHDRPGHRSRHRSQHRARPRRRPPRPRRADPHRDGRRRQGERLHAPATARSASTSTAFLDPGTFHELGTFTAVHAARRTGPHAGRRQDRRPRPGGRAAGRGLRRRHHRAAGLVVRGRQPQGGASRRAGPARWASPSSTSARPAGPASPTSWAPRASRRAASCSPPSPPAATGCPWPPPSWGRASAARRSCPPCSDFVVMVRGSCLAVTSPRVFEVATGEIISFEELGGVDVHARMTGQIDLGVETDEEAYAAIRRWLSYLPPNAGRPRPGPSAADPRQPRARPGAGRPGAGPAYPRLRHAPAWWPGCADPGSVLRAAAAVSPATSPARWPASTAGRSAFVANNPMFQAGVLDPRGLRQDHPADRAVRRLPDLPVIFLVDVPGFMVGRRSSTTACCTGGCACCRRCTCARRRR